jgi:hypothetical protein
MSSEDIKVMVITSKVCHNSFTFFQPSLPLWTTKMHRYALIFLSLLATSLTTPTAFGHEQEKKRPNVVFIMTDDQDAKMNSLDYMPAVQTHLVEKGTHYQKHYCTVAWCCPSRVSLWTGKTAHNTNVTNVEPPYGKFGVVNLPFPLCFFLMVLNNRRISEVHRGGTQRCLGSSMVATSGVSNLLCRQVNELSAYT